MRKETSINEEKSILEQIKSKSDRELAELQTHFLYESNAYLKSIKLNVQFFYYAFIVSIAIGIIVALSQ